MHGMRESCDAQQSFPLAPAQTNVESKAANPLKSKTQELISKLEEEIDNLNEMIERGCDQGLQVFHLIKSREVKQNELRSVRSIAG